MITTVTLNPCIDRSVYVSGLKVGGYNLVSHSRTDLGGKGINVSIVAHALGYDTRALCLDYMDGGTLLSDGLSHLGIPSVLVPAYGRLRENLKLYDAETGDMTEINEPGSPIDQSTMTRILQRFDALLPNTNVLVLSGSVPPGVDTGIYARLIQRAKEAKVYTVLDAAGDLLREGIKAGPDLIKPNRFEMETLCGRTLDSLEIALEEAQKVLDGGVGAVCLSLGDKGALLLNAEERWYSPGATIEVRGMQGAGDSLVAGLCIGHIEGWSSDKTLQTGIALAEGSLMREGTQLCTKQLFDRLVGKVKVERV